MEWQPIETAPRDVSFLAYWPHRESIEVTHWDDEQFHRKPNPHFGTYVLINRHTEERANQPSHWMPLPEPPNSETAVEG